MSNNTYKTQRKRGLFAYLEDGVSPDIQLLSRSHVPRLLFIFILALFYVGNTHYHEKLIRNIADRKKETAALRVDYTTLQASYMFDSKQSEVAKRVANMGLAEVPYPPLKIKSR